MHMGVTCENEAYAEVGEEVLDFLMLSHHVVFSYQRIDGRGRKDGVVGECDNTLATLLCRRCDFCYPVPMLGGVAAFALAVFVGI